MNKIIGGLLVLSLLSRPAILRVDYIAYEVYKSNARILSFILKEQSEDRITEADIDTVMNDIDINKRHIKALSLQKNEVVNRIETKMDLNSYAKKSLSQSQIGKFVEFNEVYQTENDEIGIKLLEIDQSDNLNEVQKQLLHSETDLEKVYDELQKYNEKQYDIIYSLQNIIAKGTETLELI